MKPLIAILGEYQPTSETHLATDLAIADSSSQLTVEVEGIWVSTEDINTSLFDIYSGIWLAPGSPYNNMDNLLWAISYARENNVPCLGTCGGFQHMILEYARNVLGFKDAQSQENNPDGSHLFISQLACSLAGRAMKLAFTEGSQIAAIYSSLTSVEQYYCNFGVNPEYIPHLKSRWLKVTGTDCEGKVRVIELPNHPFFLGTLFVPQARSTYETPHPIVTAFLKAVIEQANKNLV
jgi:CTP synthase (UTP-ammonia lyase)